MNINFIRHRRMLSHLSRITELCFQLNMIEFLFYIAVPESDIGKLAKKVSMDKKDFIEETKKALTQMDMGNLTFEYKVC